MSTKGQKFTEEQSKRVSEAHKGKMPKNIKLLLSPEVRKRNLEAIKNRVISPEERKIRSERMKGKLNHFWGKKHTQETIDKIIKAHKGIPSPLIGRKRPDVAGQNNCFWRGGLTLHPRYKAFMEKRREIRKKVSGKTHTLQDWLALKIKYGFMCLCCKRTEPEITLTEDHVIPLTKNGDDGIENIQPLCMSCNNRKYTKIFDYRINYEKQRV